MGRYLSLVLGLLLVSASPAGAREFELPPGATIVAGTGGPSTEETRGDGGPAVEAAFDRIHSIDHMGDGSLLVADSDDHRIRIIRPGGTIATNAGPDEEVDDPLAVAGTTWAPSAPLTPNGFVAAEADDVAIWSQVESVPGEPASIQLVKTEIMPDEGASDVELSGDGTGYLVAQSGGAGDTEGRILIARFNTFTNMWDVGELLDELPDSRGVAALPGSGFLVTTGFDDCRVLKRQDGLTTVMAGTGACAVDDPQTPGTGPLPGNGGPATSAPLRRPHDVVPTPDGGFVIAEGALARHVSAGGTITTLFDTSLWFDDAIPPTPEAIEVLPDGDILVGVQRRILRFDTNYAAAPEPTPTPTPTPTPEPATPSPTPAPSGPNPSPPPSAPPTTTETFTAKIRKAKNGAKLKLALKAAGATKVKYQWLRNGKKIKRARKSSYRIKRRDRGKKLSCRVTFTVDGTKRSLTTNAVKVPAKD